MSRPNPMRRAREPAPDASADAHAPTSSGGRPDATWRAHLAWLRTRLRGRFSADLADDLAQETYLRIVGRGIDAPVENPRGLLMTVASSLARDIFRRERVRADYAARAPQVHAPMEAARHTAEDDLQVREAIRSLPPKLRDVLLLSKIGGLTNREIAQRYREDEVEAWRISRDHSVRRVSASPTRPVPAPQAGFPGPAAGPAAPPPRSAAAQPLERARAPEAAAPAQPRPADTGGPSHPPTVSAKTRRRRSQHAQAIAQQMLFDF